MIKFYIVWFMQINFIAHPKSMSIKSYNEVSISFSITKDFLCESECGYSSGKLIN